MEIKTEKQASEKEGEKYWKEEKKNITQKIDLQIPAKKSTHENRSKLN